MYKRNLILTGLAVTASINVWSQQKTNHDRQNILFIVCDDLRPELGCYGRKQIKSPNIDRWATQSVLFDRAYCNIAVSGASRASLLTGLRPTKNLLQTWNARKHSKKCTFYTLRFGCSFAAVNTIKPQLL